MFSVTLQNSQSGHHQYLSHNHASVFDENGDLVGELMYSTYEAHQAHEDNAAQRFIAHADGYLHQHADLLFDPNHSLATLPSLISDDIKSETQTVCIIDDITISSDFLTHERLELLIECIRFVGDQSDLLLIPNWSRLSKFIEVLPLDMLRCVQLFSITPINVNTLVGFPNDFDHFEQIHRKRLN